MSERYGKVARELLSGDERSAGGDGEKSSPSVSNSESSQSPESSNGAGSASLLRSFTFVFAMDVRVAVMARRLDLTLVQGYISQLEHLHKLFVPHQDAPARKKRIHFHILEHASTREEKHADIMPTEQVLAILDNKPRTPRKVSFAQRIDRLEKLARSETSLGALKTACAVRRSYGVDLRKSR